MGGFKRLYHNGICYFERTTMGFANSERTTMGFAIWSVPQWDQLNGERTTMGFAIWSAPRWFMSSDCEPLVKELFTLYLVYHNGIYHD